MTLAKHPYSIPEEIDALLSVFETKGYECFLVGGAVRDFLLGITPKDFDIAFSGTAEDAMKFLRNQGYRVIPTGLKHGTITVITEGRLVEVTSYRSDGDYLDSRHPESIEIVKSIQEDLARRDFTINAIALSKRGDIVDPFDGRKDLEHQIIKCVGVPSKRFEEDALRILRALRFASRFGYEIEKETSEAILKLKDTLLEISWERVGDELQA